ncbi:MAG: BrnT family toxin [Oscillospiraceae bacterium]|jgi:uncharacterized DUF497 family protein|nr:BrnT family toxin [Oscillospiraceae bacterium]
MIFEWDERKNRRNIVKHGITFEEATTVFKDENAFIVYDEDNADYEERFNIIGLSQLTRMLIVCHCYREEDTIIRIISARKAEPHEVAEYGR